jgi:NosR/NirI family transcriptional regulator, nitrous oxide reductase regulator
VLAQPQRLKPVALQLFRCAVLVTIVLLINAHRTRLRIEADAPVKLSEIQRYYPKAAELERDNEKLGLHVLDNDKNRIGYVIRTRPVCDSIIGYCGPTDTLIAFNDQQKALGIAIRSSADTFTHVSDVQSDTYFMNTWNGKTWQQIASMDLKKEGVEGVSGATMTSMAIAQGISHRLKHTDQQAVPPPMRFGLRDVGLLGMLALSILIAFSHHRGKNWVRRALQISVIGYIGIINGDLIAQSLLSGWAASAVPWRMAPGLVLMVAAALVIPWTTRRALYCQYLCPHGAAQELLDRVSPKRFRIHLPRSVSAGLRWLPVLLLALTAGVTMLMLPLDLASIEAFDAYIIRSAGWATITIAIVGLVASLFVPMAYCKFGCPTGALLEFIRSHGSSDHFGKRDIAALLLVGWVVTLFFGHEMFTSWIAGIN